MSHIGNASIHISKFFVILKYIRPDQRHGMNKFYLSMFELMEINKESEF